MVEGTKTMRGVMSNPFEKIRQDQLKKKQAQDAKEAEMDRQYMQAHKIRQQTEFHYDALVISVLRELQIAFYPHESVHGFHEQMRIAGHFLGWGIGKYRPYRPYPGGTYEHCKENFEIGVRIDLVFDQNNHPICFNCYGNRTGHCTNECTRGLTRQELVEVLVQMHS